MTRDGDALLADPVDAIRPTLRDGRPLAALLSDARGPLEGAGVPFLVNPISVDGGEVWGTWFGPAVRLWAPRWPCASYFQFEALHRRRFHELVRKVGEIEDALVDARGELRDGALMRLLDAAGPAWATIAQDLGPTWARGLRYREALTGRAGRLPRDMADAVAIMRDHEPVAFRAADFGPLLADLVALSKILRGA